MEIKLDSALRFKWLITGVVTGVSSAFGIVMTVMTLLTKNG
jgi:hypothetical protein